MLKFKTRYNCISIKKRGYTCIFPPHHTYFCRIFLLIKSIQRDEWVVSHGIYSYQVIKDSGRSNYIESVTQQRRKSAPPFLSTSHCEFNGARSCTHAQKTIPLAPIHSFTRQIRYKPAKSSTLNACDN